MKTCSTRYSDLRRPILHPALRWRPAIPRLPCAREAIRRCPTARARAPASRAIDRRARVSTGAWASRAEARVRVGEGEVQGSVGSNFLGRDFSYRSGRVGRCEHPRTCPVEKFAWEGRQPIEAAHHGAPTHHLGRRVAVRDRFWRRTASWAHGAGADHGGSASAPTAIIRLRALASCSLPFDM